MICYCFINPCYLHSVPWLYRVYQISLQKYSNWPWQLPYWGVFRHLLHNYLLNILVVTIPILWSHRVSGLVFRWEQFRAILLLVLYLVLVFVVLDVALLRLLDEMVAFLELGLCNRHPCDYSLYLDNLIDEILLESSWSNEVLAKVTIDADFLGHNFLWESS